MGERSWRQLAVSSVLVTSLALVACSTAVPGRAAVPAGGIAVAKPVVAEQAAATRPTAPADITVRAVDLRFEPATFSVTAGQPVHLVLKNAGSVPHDLVVIGLEADVHEVAGHDEADRQGGPATMAGDRHGEEGDHHAAATDHHAAAADDQAARARVHVHALPGATEEIEFTPLKPGTYEVICTLPGHKEAGMVGKLVVRQEVVSSH